MSSINHYIKAILDQRKLSNYCRFFGYLEDYIDALEEDPYLSIWKEVITEYPDMKICVDLRYKVNHEAIANKIIHYRDIQKVAEESLKCPYILLYQVDGEEVAILFSTKNYYLAKGIYYCMTEQGNELETVKNNLVAISLDQPKSIMPILHSLIEKKKTPGFVQRHLDNEYYHSLEEVKEQIHLINEKGIQEITKKQEITKSYIDECIIEWFLYKKVLYIATMMKENKEIDKKEVRLKAKENAMEIQFIPYYELWKQKK